MNTIAPAERTRLNSSRSVATPNGTASDDASSSITTPAIQQAQVQLTEGLCDGTTGTAGGRGAASISGSLHLPTGADALHYSNGRLYFNYTLRVGGSTRTGQYLYGNAIELVLPNSLFLAVQPGDLQIGSPCSLIVNGNVAWSGALSKLS
jgi:hypothetical protein